jgi:hypothetical protein
MPSELVVCPHCGTQNSLTLLPRGRCRNCGTDLVTEARNVAGGDNPTGPLVVEDAPEPTPGTKDHASTDGENS